MAFGIRIPTVKGLGQDQQRQTSTSQKREEIHRVYELFDVHQEIEVTKGKQESCQFPFEATASAPPERPHTFISFFTVRIYLINVARYIQTIRVFTIFY